MIRGSERTTNYMRLHNIVSLTSSLVRIYALILGQKKSQFILLRKPNEPEVVLDSYRNAARNAVSVLRELK